MRVLVAGDFCPRNRLATIIQNGDGSSVLKEVKQLIHKEYDYAIVNYESPVTESGFNPIIKCGPNLHSSRSGVALCKDTGFNCLCLANNHIFDFGYDGMMATTKAAENEGLQWVGVGDNIRKAGRVLYVECAGDKLAIINCCEHEFSVAGDNTPGANPINPCQQYYAIQEAKENADYVLLIVHGGHEHWQLPSPRMVELYRYFVDVGADAVVNHHQHCFSGYEVYKKKPIFYGLGNFCFDIEPKRIDAPWNYGYLAGLEFKNNSTSFVIHPYKQCAEEAIVTLLPSNAFDEDFNRINSIIENPEKLSAETGLYYRKEMNRIKSIVEPLRNRFVAGAQRKGWLPSFVNKSWLVTLQGFVQCEAHHDKLMYFFKNFK